MLTQYAIFGTLGSLGLIFLRKQLIGITQQFIIDKAWHDNSLILKL